MFKRLIERIIKHIRNKSNIVSPSAVLAGYMFSFRTGATIGIMRGQYNKVNYKAHKIRVRNVYAPEYGNIGEMKIFLKELTYYEL